ncbi:MAG: 4-hydroxyphenylacetate 3-monooxygenase, oxygenase component, partial [Chloroflexi bacterium]|nr:4-hydroxyphenylacetate 3-monooxygenase, oxygenase component [Chloroflexota bacterium]
MPARTGEEYLAKLKENPPEVWIDGQRVRDPTTHPAFRRGARSMADLLDMQHEPALRDEMTYDSPSSGERVGTSFLTPRTPEDIVRRRLMMTRWARHSGGMMGRSPDYLNAGLMAVAAASSYFGGNRPEFKANVERYYEHVRENDLCMTHTLVNMRRTRSAESVMGADDVGLRVTRETDEGIVVKGARVLATLGPISDEIMVFPSTVLSTIPNAERYAFAFSSTTATPALKFVCRESF